MLNPDQFFRVVIATLVRRFLGMPPLMPRSADRRSADAYPKAPASPSAVNTPHTEWGQAFADNLNRNVMAEHEKDLARLPADIRASKTPEEWHRTSSLEILRLARDPEAFEGIRAASQAAPQAARPIDGDGDGDGDYPHAAN